MSEASPYIRTAAHREDITKIYDPAAIERAERIASYEATMRDVMDWYGTEDPLSEKVNFETIEMRTKSTFSWFDDFRAKAHETADKMVLNEAAALTILATMAGETTGGTKDQPWVEQEGSMAERYLRHMPSRLAGALASRVIPSIEAKDYMPLYVATDCLYAASSGLDYMAVMGDNGRIRVHDPKAYEERSTLYRQTAEKIAATMARHFFDTLQPEEQKEQRSFIRKLGALMCTISVENAFIQNAESPTAEPTVQLDEKKMFSLLTSIIGASYLALDAAKVVKDKTDKGDLHELLFLLDLNYLFATNRAASNSWYVRSTTERHDQPSINRPSRRRGYDFMASNGKRSLLMQVKSNKHQEAARKQQAGYKDYHPWIFEFADDNFPDVDKRTLRARLVAYQEWIDAGYPAEGSARVERYVLDSAKEAFQACLHEETLKESERLIRGFEGNLTRAERRRLMRNSGDFSQRKTRAKR